MNRGGRHVPHTEGKEEALTGWSGLGSRLGQDMTSESRAGDRGRASAKYTGRDCGEKRVPATRPPRPDVFQACSLRENEDVKENRDLAMKGVEKITSQGGARGGYNMENQDQVRIRGFGTTDVQRTTWPSADSLRNVCKMRGPASYGRERHGTGTERAGWAAGAVGMWALDVVGTWGRARPRSFLYLTCKTP